ncbi:hypothetical protein C2857_005229 [Epichloe festucae Fl1]|uniref:DNA replication regulator Sld3 C-terminal domain-containing protein n=1 Tax=Epichloe festucae (strain Fl1) TaxID=877507 RepID=A0A7S9KSR0_EPIFF|nr:hypothetical protein C2857_005229 [Epichloe festucae Fl1]
MSSPTALGADASRPRSGILTPSSDGSLNRRRGSVSPAQHTKKRADAVAMDYLLNASITVKPHPPNIQAQPRSLSPLMLLPREHLSLSSLDFSSPTSGFPQTRFVESHIKILDLESRLGSAPTVVIARSDSKGTTFALERQENGLYVMCRLGSWVDLGDLARYATALCRCRLAPRRQDQLEPDAETSLPTPHLHGEQKKKRAAIEAIQNLVRKKSKSQPTLEVDINRQESDGPAADSQPSQLPTPDITSDEVNAAERQANVETVSATNNLDNAPPAESQQTAEMIFNTIRTHYFEALYRSMGSLAYFAKGPLSRARSAFHLDLESNLEMEDLVDFLKSLILTTVQIDKKYRETIPEVIGKMKAFVDSSDEGGKKKRKPRKMKLGKDSLYPLEDESIRKWWNTNKPEPTGHDMNISPSQLKSHVSMLRTRETQLQMILILEILALEPLSNVREAAESNLPTLPGAESQLPEPSMAPPAKKRNKHNLPVLVDVHADRLTIWQSTASDEQLMMSDSQPAQASADGQVQQKASSEPLKDFCVDVIVPFFSARLPGLCDAINRKLGGPVIVSSVQSRSLRRSSSKREQKLGAATKRPAPPSNRRTLQRALSTEQMHRRSVSRGPSNAIALMRSATSTTLSGVKREGSEPLSLKDLPRGESLLARSRQSSLSRSNSTSNLEDMKANKKSLVKAELKDAISALRKPNREVVGKAMAEADERRATAGHSAKRGRRMARSSLASSIQVQATPANKRFQDVLAIQPESDAGKPLNSTEELIPPSSVGHMVPSTGHRHGHRDALADCVSPARPSTQHSFIRRMAHDEPAMPPSSPLVGNKAASIDDFAPSRSTATASTGARPTSSDGAQGVMATPVKRTVSRLELIQTPVSAHGPNQLNKVSIYDKLGWDDDFDDI